MPRQANNHKLCPKCGTEKPISEYGYNRSTADGLQAYCKACRNAMAQDIRKTPEHKAYAKQYEQSPKVKEYRRQYQKNWRRSTLYKLWRWQFRARTQPKHKAREAVKYAIARGMFPKATSLVCGTILDSNGTIVSITGDCTRFGLEYHHYLGYDEAHWLDVQSLCKECHTLTRDSE